MIKKVNIILAVAFIAMLGTKGLKELKASRTAAANSKAAARQAEMPQKGVSTLAPCVYYAYWAGYSVEDPISNRNGVLLDMIRAIFPNAKYRQLKGNAEEFAKALHEDPQAVVVGFGEHPALKGVIAAPTPMMYYPLVLMTLRTNPWHYKDASSLDGLKILANEAFLDYKVLRDLRDRLGKDSKFLQIMPASVSKVELAEMVESGKADAFVATGKKNMEGALRDGFMSVRLIQRFRQSAQIGNEGTFLFVSGKDPEFAKRIVDDYEAGIRRIEKSGELRRIFAYYGMDPTPAKTFERPAAAAAKGK